MPRPIASILPSPRRVRPAAAIRAIASIEVRIRFIAKPFSTDSACAMLRIDNGSTASITDAEPRTLRASMSMDAAIPESRAALAYLTTRKSRSTRRYRPAMTSREITGLCSLCCCQAQRRLTGSAPVMTDTIANSSPYGMLREYCRT